MSVTISKTTECLFLKHNLPRCHIVSVYKIVIEVTSQRKVEKAITSGNCGLSCIVVVLIAVIAACIP